MRYKRVDITKDKLKKLYVDKKLSIGKIAKMFKCSKSTIWTKLCQYDIKIRTKSEANKGKYRIKISKEVLRDLYTNKKLDTNEIARKFNCSTTTIVKRLHHHDIPIRRTRIDITHDRLADLYLGKKMTIYQIAKKFNCNEVTVFNRLKQYNIPIWRNELKKGQYKVEIPNDKLRDLYIDKGLTISEIKKRFNYSRTTLHKRLYRYGIPVRSVSEALKGKPSNMKGKHHTLETKKKISRATIKQLASGKMKRKDTSIELKMERELKRNNIYYQKQVPLCNITVADFYLPEYKIIIYADGDYWHNLPEVKDRDKNQNKILEKNGYKVFRFTETEINKSAKDVLVKLQNALENSNIQF